MVLAIILTETSTQNMNYETFHFEHIEDKSIQTQISQSNFVTAVVAQF